MPTVRKKNYRNVFAGRPLKTKLSGRLPRRPLKTKHSALSAVYYGKRNDDRNCNHIALYLAFRQSGFPLLAVILLRRDRRMKAELAKKDLSNRHYEEMLYASKDGYLTHSVYKSKDYQYCSRRLATMLNLSAGEKVRLPTLPPHLSAPMPKS